MYFETITDGYRGRYSYDGCNTIGLISQTGDASGHLTIKGLSRDNGTMSLAVYMQGYGLTISADSNCTLESYIEED